MANHRLSLFVLLVTFFVIEGAPASSGATYDVHESPDSRIAFLPKDSAPSSGNERNLLLNNDQLQLILGDTAVQVVDGDTSAGPVVGDPRLEVVDGSNEDETQQTTSIHEGEVPTTPAFDIDNETTRSIVIDYDLDAISTTGQNSTSAESRPLDFGLLNDSDSKSAVEFPRPTKIAKKIYSVSRLDRLKPVNSTNGATNGLKRKFEKPKSRVPDFEFNQLDAEENTSLRNNVVEPKNQTNDRGSANVLMSTSPGSGVRTTLPPTISTTVFLNELATTSTTIRSPTAEGTTDKSKTPLKVQPSNQCGDMVSDCAIQVDLCDHPDYKELLARMCPSTCHACFHIPPPGLGCADASPLCSRRKRYCSVSYHQALMNRVCPGTCRTC